jgi:hypothetical protein
VNDFSYLRKIIPKIGKQKKEAVSKGFNLFIQPPPREPKI